MAANQYAQEVDIMNAALFGFEPNHAEFVTQTNAAALDMRAYAVSMVASVANGGPSNATLATTVLTNMGVSSFPGLNDALVAVFVANPAARGVVVAQLGLILAGMSADPIYGAASVAWNSAMANAYTYSNNLASDVRAPSDFTVHTTPNTLTTGVDNFGGPTFFAPLNGVNNTLQSGDTLTGTGANSVLNADLAAVFGYGVAPTTNNVHTISITSYAQALLPSGNNTLSNTGVAAEVLAGKMTGVTDWVDGPAKAGTAAQGLINPLPGSRADVVIENIQLPHGNTSSDVTSAVTFTLRNTEPGISTTATTTGPSFKAYFDQQALKQATTPPSTSVVLAVGNATPLSDAAFALNPISNPVSAGNPFPFSYNGFTLTINGVGHTFTFSLPPATTDLALLEAATGVAAQSADFLKLIQDAMDQANGFKTLADFNITAALDGTFNYPDQAFHARAVPAITLSGLAGTTLGSGAFTLSGTTSGTSGQQNEFIANPTLNTPNALITSNIVLDNVGLGAMPQFNNYSGSTEGPAGDVVIGSLATSGGVQQFNVVVQNGSWINSLSSTNNTLRVVNIASDIAGSSIGGVVPTSVANNGGGQYLAVGTELSYGANNLVTYASPGLFVGTNGFTDVQTINAVNGPNGAFNGSLLMGETIDYAGFVKYLAGATGVVPFSITLGNQSNGVALPGQGGAFFNSVNLAIDPNVAGSGNFNETITGGTANDAIKVAVVMPNGALAPNGAWEVSMTASMTKLELGNLVINAGTGDNTVIFQGGGAAQISTNAGNDTVYIDNTGASGAGAPNPAGLHEVWVSNTTTVTSFLPVAPTAGETTPGLGATAQVETTYWQGVNTGFTDVTETVAVSATDLQGVTVEIMTPAVLVQAVNSQEVAADVQTAYGAYVAGLALHNSVGPVGSVYTWNNVAGGYTLSDAITDASGNTITVTVGSDYVVSQSAIDLQQGTNTLTSATAGATNVFGTGGVTNAITTLGTASATEQQTVTWSPLQGHLATESIGRIVVTDTQTSGTSVILASTIATEVLTAFNGGGGALDLGVAVTGGTLYTDAGNSTTVFIPTATGTTWTVTQPVPMPGTAQDLLTYGTPGVFAGTTLVGAGASTAGTLAGLVNSTVSLDLYGNLTTNGQYQTGAVPHTFTGSGETVTVSYEGYSVTATITAATALTTANYTSTDVNNAIASAVNNDPTMSKLIHVTQGSAAESLIFNSLVDGLQNVPTIAFTHTGTGTATSLSLSTADGLALNQYTVLEQGKGDGTSTGVSGALLVGANSTLVNNSNITDTGSTATGYNVIDLSSNTTTSAVTGSQVGSQNTVTLSGTGQTIITNYKVGLDTITTSATHGVVLNAVNDGISATYSGAGALNVNALSLALLATSGVYEGATMGTATHISGATTGAGLVVLENATTTSIYYASNVAALGSGTTLEAVLVGVTPTATAIHLV